MIWKTTFALLVDKATLFFNKKNCAQPPSFFKTLTILLIFSGCFFNFSTGYSQTVPDGNFNATEYSDAQTSAVDSNASTTCDVVKVLATINNDIPADPYLLLGFQVGNGGNAIFRYYFDTDGKSIGTDRFANKEIVVGDADLVVQINTNNSNSLEVLKWDGTSFQTSATNFGIKAAVGDFAPGDSRFLEVKIPLGAGSVIDICNLVGGNSIQLGKYISVKGGNLNSNLCPHPPLVFDIALSGVISGGKEYCSGKYIPTELALNGSFGNVVDWEKNEGNGWVSVGNIPTIAGNYTPSDVTVTTRYRAIIVSAVCANLKIPSQEATITINTLDNASFSYSGSPYCVDGTDVTPTVTGVSGGSFNSTTGLIINSTTGVIDLDASTPGPYTIIYSTDNAGTCTNISTQSITIVGTPAAPVAGEVTQPTCTTATGSFQIADFDADSDYDFSPNVVSISDSGLVTATAGDYSFTLTNEAKCISPASENIKVNEQLDTPAAPVAGEVTQPTCTTATGSFQIADFDADSDYDFTPSVVSISDSGLVTANAGDYSFTVTNEAGCISPASENIKVNEQLDTPAAPVAGEVTQPTCTTATGSFQIADFDADSDYDFTPGVVSISDSGLVTANAGDYSFTVTNEAGCISPASENVKVNEQLDTPAAPVAGTVTQPTCTTATGSFQIADFDADSDYDFTPGVVSVSDSGLVTANAGNYSFTVTNAAGCISPASENLEVNEQLNTPAAPVAGTVTQPTCDSATGTFQIVDYDANSDYDFTPGVVSISDSGLVTANAGDYSFTLTNEAKCISPASENIKVNEQLDTPAAPVAGEVTQPTCTTATGSFQIADFDADSDYDFTPSVVSISDSGLVTANAGDYSFTVTNAAGCISPASENLEVNEQLNTPAAPVAGTVTQPTCDSATGTFQIVDYDANSDYDFTPSVVSISDSGLVTANAGNYSFTVTNEAGCISPASENIKVNEQLDTPAAPVAGEVTQPTCTTATGSFQIADFDADSDYDFSPNVVSISDSGLVTATAGDYSFTLTNEAKCISPASENIKVNEQLDTPAAPVAGEVTQPTCTTATGSFQIADFDADSDYDFTPSVVSISDSGLVTANAGDYSFTVTNEAGCISPASENIKVNEQLDTPAAPVAGEVTQPTCTTATGSFQIADFDADSDYDFTPGVVSVSDSGLVTANAGNYSFTVTNAAGCISPASENIKVNEQLNTPAAPVVDSSINTTCNLNNGSIVLVAVDDVEFSIDGVNYQTSTLFSDLATGTYSITTRFIDGECISSSTEVEIIAIPDTEDPILSEMSDINVNTDAGVCGAVITFSAPSATDNCEGTVITLNEGSMASGSEFPVGTATVTYTATDAAGNASTVSFDVIVVDNEAPAIACPANVNQTAEAGESFAIVTFEDATATDNCDVSVEQTAGLTSGSQFPIGVSTVEFTATDASGNTSTCNFTITITDNDPPTILCPANIDMDVDAGICGAVVSFETPTATDNSGQEVTVTQTAGPASGEVFPVGTTTVTFTATDAAGNTASCSFDVTVNDNEDPTFGSVSDITVNTDAGICGAVVNYEVPTATDNCEGTEVSLTEGLASGSEFPVGTTTVTYTATDAAGNTSTVSFDVIVVDNEDPAITCPANVNQTTEAGESFAIVTFEDATATDNCDVIVEQTAGLTSGSQFPIGESTVTFTATDASGNTSSCSFTITITDNDPPTIVCPANIDMDVDAGICGAVVSFETPTATDNSGLEVTVTQTAGPASGEVFPVGTTTVTFTATDAAGNTASCSFDVTVNDTEDPTFESVSDITVNTDAGVCGAVVSFEAPTATDNCEGTVVTLNEGSLASGSEFPVGTTTVTYTATDAVGNTVSTSFTVTIIDNEAPVIVCIDNISQATDMGEATAVVTFEAPLGTDNCGATTEQTAGLPSGSEFPIGTTTNTYIVTDAAGNTATCSFTVTIIDEEDPTISCPANINMNVDAGLCGAVVEFEMPVANDNSGNVSVTQTAGPASGEVFPVGTTTVTFTATDAAGNTASCSFDVTVNDTEDPTFESVSDINVNTDAGVCGAVITFSAPSATDNCEGTVITLNEGSMASGSEFPVGTTTVTYTATDAAGNTSTVSFDVIVVDNEDPAITCPANVNQTTEAGESFAIVTFEDATATDNCDVIVEQTAGLTSGSQFPIGESNVEFTATDASGNTSSCSFTITITDNDPPTILCPANIDMEVDAGICGAVVSFETPTASDNSGQEVTVTQTAGPASGEEFPVGTTTVTFTATDAAGNTASCSFDVSVNDTEDPTFGSVSDITVNTDAGVCGAVVSFEAPTATDNCEGTVVTLNEGSLASGSEFPVGTTTVTYTATDAAGNTSTVSFDVIVVDNEDPAITCPANVNQTTEAGESFAIVTFEDATATDNCDVTVEQTAGLTSGSQFPIGESTVTFTATDASGNTSSCSFTITITDNDPPTILCPANIDMEVDAGICGAVVSFETPTATDNSGQEVTVTQTAGPASGEVFPVGTTTVTFTATDAAGNTASCSFDVTVNDTEDPTFGSVSDITVNTDAGVCGAVVTFSAPSATDNCEGTVVTLNEGSLASGSEFPVGTTTVTYTATDAVGNTVSTSFTVTIIDNEAPVINCAENISLTVDFGVTSLVVNYESVTATDNCPDTTIEQTAGLSSGSSFPIGTTTNTFVVTDASGNTATCSFDIIVEELLDEKPEPPLVVEVIQPTCEVATGTITVQTIEGLTYSINGTDYQESGVFINLEPGTYSITAQNSSGQISDAVQVTLDEPTATTIQTTTVDLCIEDSVYDLFELLSGDFDETGTWVDTDQTGALAGSFIDPKLLAVGNYNFTYVLGGNCPSTTSVLVSINDLCVVDPEGCDIDGIKAGVSKAVTPNGDGFNDFFEIKVDPLCGFRFGVQIFNRWGAEIYSNPNYTNEWDGFSNKSFTGSNQLPSGTYFYILTVNNGEIAPIQGYIYLGTK